MPNPYQSIVDTLDLRAAITEASESNDLIPPRPEDKVGGELGTRFLESLRRDLERGAYDPQPAYTVAVPKSTVATRPAALLSLEDRVIFAAIVNALKSRIESALLGEDIVFWPRGIATTKRWPDFENAAADQTFSHVVRADIAGFYESIDHEQLAVGVVRATGQREVVDALVHFLARVMRSRHGLPQGLASSDALATIYLATLDFSMVREGFQYFRHGDDVRIGVEKYDDGRRAVFLLESELRRHGLLLNSSKTRILRQRTYVRELSSFQKTVDETQKRLIDTKVQRITQDPDKLAEAIHDAEMDQLAWDLFYHERISLGEAIKKLRPSIKASEVELAEQLFLATVKKRPGRANSLDSKLFQQFLKKSLIGLSAAQSNVGLEYAGKLLRSFPETSKFLCSYLESLSPGESAMVASQVEKAIHNRHVTEWELAWMVRVLIQVSTSVSDRMLNALKKIVNSPHGHWLSVVEIAKLLASRGKLERHDLVTLWNTCPHVFRVDLVIAAGRVAGSPPWATAFLSAAKSDRIQVVAASHLRTAESDSSI